MHDRPVIEPSERVTFPAALFAAFAFVLHPAPHRTLAAQSAVQPLRHAIRFHRAKTWRYEDRAGVARTPTRYAERHTSAVGFLRWDDRLWLRRQKRARQLHPRPVIAHVALWMCIHGDEAGDWHNEDTGHNGHYGGLQMSLGWDGLVGNAASLSPQAQMEAAETGYRQSGYSRSWLLGQWYHPDCMMYA